MRTAEPEGKVDQETTIIIWTDEIPNSSIQP